MTPDEEIRLLKMLKEHENATVVWDFFVWLMKAIATVAAGVTPLFLVWKYIISDFLTRVPMK